MTLETHEAGPEDMAIYDAIANNKRRLEVAQRMADALRNLLLKDIDGLPPFEADARAALAEWEATR